MITMELFFVNARFRLPIIPFIIVFASFTIYWLAQQLIKKDLKSLPIFFIIFIPFFLELSSAEQSSRPNQ